MVDLSKYTEIIIWGAAFSPNEIEGDATSHGYAVEKLYKLLKENDYADKLAFFVDSNTKLYGKKKFDREVKAPAEILKYPKALVIINSLSMKAILSSIDHMGISNDCMIIPFYFYHGVLGRPYNNLIAQKHMFDHKDKILQLFETSDQLTKRYLDIIIQLRENGMDDIYTREFYSETGESLEYFCDTELAPKGEVTFIDVGAFEGESIEPIREFYGDRLRKCIVFEPDTTSIQKLKNYLIQKQMDDKAVVFPYALGDENKTVHFLETGSTSQQSESGGVEVQQKAFDLIENLEIYGDPMVKMDIEGGELSALKGMEIFIKERQPYLAICLYHKEADLFDIPNYIKNLCPDYRIYIRGGWHLECWAIPKRHDLKEC